MSVEAMTWVFKHSDERLGRRLVLLALADYAQDDGTYAWPSVESIAAKARLSRRQVQECLRGLEEDGSIVQTGRSKHGTNIYTVAMGGAESASPRAGGAESDVGARNTTEGARNTTESTSDFSPDPSLGPVIGPTHPPGGSLVAIAENRIEPLNAQALVAWYVDYVYETGAPRVSKTTGIVAREVKQLLDDGINSRVIEEALRLMVDRRLHPSTLATLILEAAAGPPRPRPKPDAMRYGRGVTAQQVFDGTRGLT